MGNIDKDGWSTSWSNECDGYKQVIVVVDTEPPATEETLKPLEPDRLV